MDQVLEDAKHDRKRLEDSDSCRQRFRRAAVPLLGVALWIVLSVAHGAVTEANVRPPHDGAQSGHSVTRVREGASSSASLTTLSTMKVHASATAAGQPSDNGATVVPSTTTTPAATTAPTVDNSTVGTAVSPTTASASSGSAGGPSVESTTPPASKSRPAVASNPRESAAAFQVGVTHTQISADLWWNPNAVHSARDVLYETVRLQNQHLMGWGTLNPEPSKGVYDWSSLDDRINLIRASGGVPIMTLCCAPDWMKGGKPGATDWSQLEVPPLPEHYDDYAKLAAGAAARYPDVKYFQVWNELKGFYLASENRWNYEAYTAFYNRIYDAVKAVRPDAQIGGPYVVMDSWAGPAEASHPSVLGGPWGILDQRPLDVISYWLAHAHGADFIAVDGDIETKRGQLTTDPYTALGKFATVNTWIRQHTSLPIWWSEFYVTTPRPLETAVGIDLMVAALKATKNSGASVVLLWDPNGSGQINWSSRLWTDVRNQGGGQPTPLAGRLAEEFVKQ